MPSRCLQCLHDEFERLNLYLAGDTEGDGAVAVEEDPVGERVAAVGTQNAGVVVVTDVGRCPVLSLHPG